MADTTIVYFTSNREKEAFEGRIRRTLLRTIGTLPLISVSQKPIDFGINICVGELEASTINALRQIQLGAAAATTKFITLAESDYLYPREYFRLKPARDDTAYLATPIYVYFAQSRKTKFFTLKRGNSDSAMIAGRQCLIDGIESALGNHGMWSSSPDFHFAHLLKLLRLENFPLSIPAVTFKTDENMHRKSPFSRTRICTELPDWGTAHALIRKYLG